MNLTSSSRQDQISGILLLLSNSLAFVSSDQVPSFFLFLFLSSRLSCFLGEMGFDSVKVMENWQSKTSNENEKKKKKRRRKKNNNVRNSEHYEEEANGCWVKFRYIVCCASSTSDVETSLTLSTSTGMPSSFGSFLLCSIWFCNLVSCAVRVNKNPSFEIQIFFIFVSIFVTRRIFPSRVLIEQNL